MCPIVSMNKRDNKVTSVSDSLSLLRFSRRKYTNEATNEDKVLICTICESDAAQTMSEYGNADERTYSWKDTPAG